MQDDKTTHSSHVDESAMQLLQEISESVHLTVAASNIDTNKKVKSQGAGTATAKRLTKKSRSASPTAQNYFASPDCQNSAAAQAQIKDWKEIINPISHLKEKAYAKPARGRPKKIILADICSQDKDTL